MFVKGPEGKADCAASIGGRWPVLNPLACFPQIEAGARRVTFGEITGHPRPGQRETCAS